MTVSPLLHQRVARGGEFLKFARVAAGVRMGALGSALVGLVDLRAGQAAAERQAVHVTVALRGRERLRIAAALAELLGAYRVHEGSCYVDAAPRGVHGDVFSAACRSL